MKSTFTGIALIFIWQIPLSVMAYIITSSPALDGRLLPLFLLAISIGIGGGIAMYRHKTQAYAVRRKTTLLTAVGLLVVALLWLFVLHEPVAIRFVAANLSRMGFGGKAGELDFGNQVLEGAVSAIFSQYTLLFTTLSFIIYNLSFDFLRRGKQAKISAAH